MVEWSFGWLNFQRRLFRDVEKTVESSEAMLRLPSFPFYSTGLPNKIPKHTLGLWVGHIPKFGLLPVVNQTGLP
jgi:hypothetical protein